MQQNDLCIYTVHYTGKAAAAMLTELHFSNQSTLCTSIFFKKYMMLVNGSNGFGWHSFTCQRSHSFQSFVPYLCTSRNELWRKSASVYLLRLVMGNTSFSIQTMWKEFKVWGITVYTLSFVAISSPWASPLDLLSKYLSPGSTNFHPGKLKPFSWGPKLFLSCFVCQILFW